MGSKLAKVLRVREFYRGAVRLAHGFPVPRGVVGEAIVGRRAAATRWRAWATQHRTSAPLVWFHAASVGEAQAAAPLMSRLRSAAGGLQIIFTYSSPSMARWPGRWPAERADYVPPDDPGTLGAVFDALRPALLCFSRGDLWPELVGVATARGVPVAVVGGTMRPGSRRYRWTGRLILGETHRALSHVGTVSEGDRTRWISAGVPAQRITVTGDPRHDWLLERDVNLAPVRALDAWRRPGPVLVAGSVEPGDVAPLAAGVARASASLPRLRVLAVPHAPADSDVVLAGVRRTGLAAAVWTGPPAPVPDAAVLVVGASGLLADLYPAGDVAYVGGGFRRGRLHSAAEPAAFALPVVAGPEGADDRDFARMIAAGGATAVERRGDGDAMGRALLRWIADAEARRAAGIRARSCLVAGAAARETAELGRLIADKCPQNTPFAH